MRYNTVVAVRFVIVVGILSCCCSWRNILVNAGTEVCNEYVCGSVVSKCLLTQSCQCKLTDCHCCKDCLNCLGNLYTECCGCLDMCPRHNETFAALKPKSQIGDFEGVPELFDILTADENDEKWTTFRFPMRASLKRRYQTLGFTDVDDDDIDEVNGGAGVEANSNNGAGGGGGGAGGAGGGSSSTGGVGDGGDAIDHQASVQKHTSSIPSINCTVIYLNTCIASKKCSQYCESMGSNSFRWFHDGCCECVGANCFNYGINESRCSECPEDDDHEQGMGDDDDYGGAEDESMWNYAEEEHNFN